MLIHELLNNDLDVGPEEDIKYDVFMANNGKDNKHTIHIVRRLHF